MQDIRFGPAGNSQSFSRQGYKSTADAPRWISGMGLNAYEYQCGRGITIKEDKARVIGNNAAQCGVAMSVHSPYFINLSADDSLRHEKNAEYILKTCAVSKVMIAKRVVVHCGGLGKLTRKEALDNTIDALSDILKRMERADFSDITLCIETMGKVNVLGDIDEVCEIVASDDRLLPCIDFGHLNARTHGGYKTYDDFESIFNKLENSIGHERTVIFHSHFSKIQYSAGGEVRHLSLEDEEYGPEFDDIAKIIVKRQYSPTIICESAGVQAEDAVKLMQIYKRECNS